jgi:FkbM family methyltransferase
MKKPAPLGYRSYAQTGQDVLALYLIKKIDKIAGRKRKTGVYVDIGACYPIKVSNTYLFYRLGWRGLCIDANPASKEAFVKARPKDIFETVAVGASDGELEFHTYDNPQLNGFGEARLDSLKRQGRHLGSYKVPVRRLSGLIDQHFPDTPVDFLSVDTEGHELQVLSSLDLSRHRPRLIVLESIRSPLEAADDPAVEHLLKHGYKLRSHTGHDAFLTTG